MRFLAPLLPNEILTLVMTLRTWKRANRVLMSILTTPVDVMCGPRGRTFMPYQLRLVRVVVHNKKCLSVVTCKKVDKCVDELSVFYV